MSATFSDRLLEARNSLGLDQEQMARIAGVSKRSYCYYEGGEREPKPLVFRNLAVHGINPHYLVSGQEPLLLGEQAKPATIRMTERILETSEIDDEESGLHESAISSSVPEGVIRLPLYDLRAAAGSGAVTADYPDKLSDFEMPAWWLRQVVRVSPASVQLMVAAGDSMLPEVRPGDLLIVDTASEGVKSDGLYVFEMHDTVFIKKLQRLKDGSLKVISVNPQYETYVLAPSEMQDFKLIGRVAFHGQVT